MSVSLRKAATVSLEKVPSTRQEAECLEGQWHHCGPECVGGAA